MAQNIPMIAQFAIVAATVLAALWLWRPALRAKPIWQTMTTPLASIIGSGFLVLGPILATEFGGFAPLVMGLLCLLAYLFGAAIRFNMAVLGDSDLGQRLGLWRCSGWRSRGTKIGQHCCPIVSHAKQCVNHADLLTFY